MKRMGIWVVIVAVLMVGIVVPQQGNEAESKTIEQIKKELKQLKSQMEQAKRNAANADKQASQASQQKEATIAELDRINHELADLEGQIIDQENKIGESEATLAKTEQELAEAIDRVHARDELLKSRIKLVYMNGSVSYLDVLLQSTSFSDFLDRYNAMRSLVGQDKEILEQNKLDRIKVENTKADVEEQLTTLIAQYGQLEQLKMDKQARAKQSEVMIAQLEEKEIQYSHISEEEEENAIALAAAASKKEIELKQKENEMFKLSYNGGKLGYPLPKLYPKTSSFGSRIDPITGAKGAWHNGTDFGAPKGTSILAAEAGIVITSGWVNGFGNTIIINHGDGLWTLYAHASKLVVEQGAMVTKGQKVAEVGTTGRSTGNHLHFGVYLNEKAVDPAKYVNF